MSCPDWRRLTAWRSGDGPAPPGWRPALEHLADCGGCRLAVAALDPALLLASAPEPTVGDAEVESIVTAVRALERADRIAAGRRPRRRRQALAAAALAGALLLVPAVPRHEAEPGAVEIAAVTWPAGPLPFLGEAPAVEQVHPAEARIYRLGSDELPVVVIVSESLDL